MKTVSNLNEKKELIRIAKECKENKACESQLNPFTDAIDDNNYLLSWQIALGNIDWLKYNDIKYPENIEELAKNTAIKYQSSGFVFCKHKTKDLIKHGSYKQWYYNGKLFIECNYKNGKLHGLYKEWYINGNPILICTYKDGNLNGRYEMWFNNGRLFERSNYNNGLLDGLHERWDEDGKLIEKYEYI